MNRPFLISIYALTALSGGMIAFAEEIPFPSGLTLPLAILAYFFNEREHRIRIKTFWANIFGVVAFGTAATELLVAGFSEAGFAAEGRLLAGAHLLSYLVWIALFQDKHGRQYWWLMALGVMQVAVGAILSHDPFFGVMLLVYVFLALWTLSVFSLYQARYGFEIAGQTTTINLADAATHQNSVGESFTLGQPDEFRGAIQLDPHEHWVNRRFVLGVVTTSLLSICVGVVFFVLIPRLWVGKNYDFDDQTAPGFRKVTGFTDEVQLGEIGQILESNERILEVRFFKADSLEVLDVEETSRKLGYDEPLFRGSVMGSYENGRWHVLKESEDVTELVPPNRVNDRLIRQHYIVHDGSNRTLFGMHPVFAAEFGDDELLRPSIDVVTSILFRPDNDQKKRTKLEYVLFGYVPHRSSGPPRVWKVKSGPAQRAQRQARVELLKLPPGLDRLKQFARQISDSVNRFEASPENPLDVRIAKRIEERLQSSGEYKYSLSNEIIDPSIDPVEDFLFNRKQGHCEYSATAMALMLRAVDIPSRLVSGFKGGQMSGFSGAFAVEGRHAHAWVEAWVDGKWKTFDPTPFERAESVAQIGEERSVWSNLQSLLSGFWEQRIVRLSIDEQKTLIYAPLGDKLKELTQKASAPFGDTGRKFSDFISDPKRWFSLETFIGTAILMLLIIGSKFLWRKYGPQDAGIMRWLLRQLRLLVLRLFISEERIRVEFYERFLAILAKQGLTRRPSQTPLEFAAEVELQLAKTLSPAQLTEFPEAIATSFYRVRYGNQTLTMAELSSMSTSLDRLKVAVTGR
jgi:nitrogen fixation-related uncharacterized protein